jgi:MFS family permease
MSNATPPVVEYPRPKPEDLVHSPVSAVPSPYAGKAISPWQHFCISAYWFATNFLWGAMLTIMLPDEIRHLAPRLRAPGTVIAGIAVIVAVLVPLIAGAYSDRCASRLGRRRPFLIGGIAVNIFGLALMAVAYNSATPITEGNPARGLTILLTNPGFMLFMLAYMVVQLGNNVSSAAYSGLIPDLVPHEQRGAASGWMALQTQAGTLFGALGCGLLLGHASDVAKYFVICLVLAGVSLFTILGIKETPLPVKPPPIEWRTYVKSLWIDPRLYPDFAWVWITRALVMLGFYSIEPYINYYLIDVIGIENPAQATAKVLAIILLASSASGFYGGVLSDRIGRKRVVYLANTIISLTVLGFIFCRNLEQVLVVGVFFGIGFGAYTSVDWALGTDVLPSKVDAAKEMAVWHIAMTVPQTIGQGISGIILALMGMHEVMVHGETQYRYAISGYSVVFLLASICFALGAYFLRNVRSVT